MEAASAPEDRECLATLRKEIAADQRALETVRDRVPELGSIDLPRMKQRAREQYDGVEARRLAAARDALTLRSHGTGTVGHHTVEGLARACGTTCCCPSSASTGWRATRTWPGDAGDFRLFHGWNKRAGQKQIRQTGGS